MIDMMLKPGLIAAIVALSLMAPGKTAIAKQAVDLELIIAVDVSRSVDSYEAKLQRDGYITAFSDDRVIEAIKSGFLGKIVVLYFEWAGYGHHKVIADWTVIEDKADAKAFAAKLASVPYESARRTAISEAIDWAVPQFENNRFKSRRRVIDISGDGPNSWGRRVDEARDEAVAAGITINGLPIIDSESAYPSRWWLPNLDLYYEHCVIGGRGAFVVVANGFMDFANAVRRKLVLEIADRQPEKPRSMEALAPKRNIEVAMAGSAPPPLFRQVRAGDRIVPPCDIGERRRRNRWSDDP